MDAIGSQVESIAKISTKGMICLSWLRCDLSDCARGALKLKEITYAHCERMLSNRIQTRPLSAGAKDSRSSCGGTGHVRSSHQRGINEAKVRGARTIVIAEDDPRLRSNADDVIALPKSDTNISPLLGVLPLQMLSYHMSVMRGFDPDFPRNLSKTLTVD